MRSIKFLLDYKKAKIFLFKKSNKYFPGFYLLNCKVMPLKINFKRGSIVLLYELKLVDKKGDIFEKKVVGKSEKNGIGIFNDYLTVKYLKKRGLGKIVPDPIDYIKPLNLYLYNFIPGYFLQKLSEEKKEKEFLSKIPSAVKALKKIHALKIKKSEHRQERDIEDWKSYYKLVKKNWPSILNKVYFWIKKGFSLREKNEKIFLSSPHRLIHGDFYSRNILINKKNLKLIDFSNSAVSDPINDVSNFLINTELMLEYDFPEKYKIIMEKIKNILNNSFFNGLPTKKEVIRINYYIFKNIIRIIACTARDEGGKMKNPGSEKTIAKLMKFAQEKYKNTL